MRLSRSTEYNLRINEMFQRDIFTMTDRGPEIRYTENQLDYVWGKTMMRMIMEVQCLAVAMIVTAQVWILAYYGSSVFESLVGDEISLPLLYILAIVAGTMTYVRPTYWRVAMSLAVYSVTIYFSMMVTNLAVKILMTPGLADLLQQERKNSGVWVPWAIGFALHMQICISSIIIAMVCLRDMYSFNPQMVTTPATVVSKPGATSPKHHIVVQRPPHGSTNNRIPSNLCNV